MTTEEFLDFLEKEIMTEEDRENIFMPPLEPQIALNILKNHFLGEDWYTVNPIGVKQVNTEIIYSILEKYPRHYPKKNRFFNGIKDLLRSIWKGKRNNLK